MGTLSPEYGYETKKIYYAVKYIFYAFSLIAYGICRVNEGRGKIFREDESCLHDIVRVQS
jgi:hypothetical protein